MLTVIDWVRRIVVALAFCRVLYLRPIRDLEIAENIKLVLRKAETTRSYKSVLVVSSYTMIECILYTNLVPKEKKRGFHEFRKESKWRK